MSLPLFIAEVADKEFTATAVVVASLIAAGFGYGLTRVSKWLTPLAVAPAVVWTLMVVPELNDRFVGPAILRELGYGYVVLNYVSVVFPFVAVGFALRKSLKRPAEPHSPSPRVLS